MSLIFSQGYMRGNGDPNLDLQIQNGGGRIPKLYIDDLTDSVYGFNDNYLSGSKWTIILAGTLDVQTNIKVILRGPYTGPNMTNTLATKSVIPTSEPYEALGYLRVGFKGESVNSSSIFTSNNITDWVLVELRDSKNPSIIRYNRSALLKNNGDIMELDGISKLSFNNIKDELYYLCIRHRNHLSIMTNTPVDISSSVDFTSSSTSVYGSDIRIDMSGTMVLCGGKTSILDIASYSLTFGVQNNVAKLLSDNSSGQFNGYSIFDYNLDGYVRYVDAFIPPSTFINSDVLFCLNNFFSNNSSIIISGSLPEQSITINYIKESDQRVYEVMPKGTTATRPLGIEGSFRYNTTNKKLEYYNGTVWVQL